MIQFSKTGRWRISAILFGVALVALVVVYISVNIAESWQLRQQMPRLAVDSLVNALRTYHRQTGRFPNDFRELEKRVWRHKNQLDFGSDGRSLTIANYCYFYYPAKAGAVTIWIIPTGPRSGEGSTHFLLLSPDRIWRWKGAPLSLGEIGSLPGEPNDNQLKALGLTEQIPIDLQKKR